MKDNQRDIPLVLVHIGKIPGHLSANIRYLIKSFPERKLYFIGDTNPPIGGDLSQLIHIPIESLIQDWPEEFSVTDKRRFFRKNFWFTSKARLVLIPKFMRMFGVNEVIHIESDVWIHPMFPFYYFEELEAPLAFPRVDGNRGIGSVMLIKGELGIELLEKACASWPKSSDMHILGNLMNADVRVRELPSLINDHNLGAQGGWIFDGAAIGMYLFGADPKNSLGIICRFKKSPMGSSLKDLTISFIGEDLIISDRLRWNKIGSLHIHSKSKSIFSSRWRFVLDKQIKLNQRGRYYSFDFSAFLYSLRERIYRVWVKLTIRD